MLSVEVDEYHLSSDVTGWKRTIAELGNFVDPPRHNNQLTYTTYVIILFVDQILTNVGDHLPVK
jgi:hypothetical protein